MYTSTIEAGITVKEFRGDIVPEHLRNVIIGMIEHLIMPHVIFNTPMDTDKVTRQICTTLIHGIRNSRNANAQLLIHKMAP